MSELKDYSILDIEAIDDERRKIEATPGKWVPESRVYLKSEADKVITEKDKVITYARALVREDIKLILHQKYKRSLAMAERCKDKIETQAQYDDHDDWLIINEYWERWYKRWLKIAEKIHEEEAKRCEN